MVETEEQLQLPVSKKRVSRLKRILVVLVVLGVIGVIAISPAFLIGTVPPDWSPDWLTLYAFDVRLAIGPVTKAASSFLQGSFSDDRVRV